ncbi:hypothetical protein KUTeg_008560 [Tegillarca granosa]|uniref:Uncharacterized protein n=1 Tax=Tegillarca granosa TaxID=220873 RepID=A0ABQ9F9G0_TEGGR|nr:hypothetical protein KUTeg_008560 [Tegillarca granosa]
MDLICIELRWFDCLCCDLQHSWYITKEKLLLSNLDDNQEEGQRMTEIKKKQPDGNQEERQRLTEKQEERHVTHIGSLMIYNIDNCDNVATGTGASITTSNKDQDDDETHVKDILDEESSDFQGF